MRQVFLLATALLTTSGFAADPAPKDKPVAETEVPYRLTDTKHVLVRVKLNGQGPFNFILDTGAPAVFIPNKIAKKIGLKFDDKGWGEFDKFAIEGGLVVEKARTRVEDLFQLEGMNGMGMAGVDERKASIQGSDGDNGSATASNSTSDAVGSDSVSSKIAGIANDGVRASSWAVDPSGVKYAGVG